MESKIQAKIRAKFEKDGWFVLKLIKTNKNGIPDLCVMKDGVVKFVEVKTTTGVLSEMQKYRIKELTAKGFECFVWTDYKVNFLLNLDT